MSIPNNYNTQIFATVGRGQDGGEVEGGSVGRGVTNCGRLSCHLSFEESLAFYFVINDVFAFPYQSLRS